MEEIVMPQCYACTVTAEERLKQCSHCEQWSCGEHAEYHVYQAGGHVVADEVLCHACERAGHALHGPADEAIGALLREMKRLQGVERSQALKKKKQARRQQAASRKKNR
jgi:hypothetical protein